MRLPRSILPFASLLMLLAAIAVFLTSQWQAANRSRELIEHSYAVIAAALSLSKSMSDIEAGQRGFVITADESFLRPQEAASAALPGQQADLRRLLAGNAEETALLDSVEGKWREKQAQVAASIAKVRAGEVAEARAALADQPGRELMTGIRADMDRLQAAERLSLAANLAAADRSRTGLAVAVFAILALAGLGIAVSVLALTRHAKGLALDVVSQRQIARTLEETTFDLAGQVTSARAELSDIGRRFDAVLRTSPIVLTSQDAQQRYLWTRNSLPGLGTERFIGRTDADLMPEPARSRMIEAKTETLRDGEPRDFEVYLPAGEADADGRWYDVHVEAGRNDRGVVDGVTSVYMDVTERKRRERHNRLLMRELAHRSKNTLAVTQAMARQTAASSDTMEEFLERFAERLEALGRAHTLLVNEGWAGAGLEDMVRAQLGHYADLIGRQVFLSGAPLTLPTEMIQNIGLALHELATNAAKYGALSTPEGRVDIAWSAAPKPDGALAIELGWRESGGPAVSPPTRRGFGNLVIERTVARAVSGEVELDYHPQGLRWTLRFERREDGQGDGALAPQD